MKRVGERDAKARKDERANERKGEKGLGRGKGNAAPVWAVIELAGLRPDGLDPPYKLQALSVSSVTFCSAELATLP